MRIKLFCALSLEEAIAQMHAEMGEEAVVLSQHTEGGEVEIRAAVRSAPRTRRELQQELEVETCQNYVPGVRQRLLEVLRYHAMPENLGQIIISAAQRHRATAYDPQASLALGLQSIMSCQPLTCEGEQTLLVTGLPGCGKTSIVARHTRFRSGFGWPPEPVSADSKGNAARLGVLSGRYHLVRSARTPQRLCKLMSGPALGQGFMIDGPGTNPRDPNSLNHLHHFLRIEDITPVLALSAEGAVEELEETVRAFASLGIRDVILTRIDLVRRLGPVISAISSAGLSLGQLSWVPSVDSGLVSANYHRLAHLLLATTPETKQVERPMFKGAA